MDPGNSCREAVHLQGITHLGAQQKCSCSCPFWGLTDCAHHKCQKLALAQSLLQLSASAKRQSSEWANWIVWPWLCTCSKEQGNQASRSNLNQCFSEQTSSRVDSMHPSCASVEPDPNPEHICIVGTERDPGMSFSPWIVPVFLLRRTWRRVWMDMKALLTCGEMQPVHNP